jgi:tetratricopeptide (TPR) repeat protein
VNNQGAIFITLKEYDKAIPLFTTAIQIDPKYSRGYYNLGVSYAEMGDFNASIKNYKKAIQVSAEENLEAHFNLGVSYGKLKKKKDALREFNYFLSKVEPTNTNAIAEAKKKIKELESK